VIVQQSQAMQQNNMAEIVIGAIVVAVAVILGAFGYYGHINRGAAAGYELNARMPEVDGLGEGTDVRLAGIKVGTVSGLTLDPKTYIATVHMIIQNDIQIPVDSSLLVTQNGLLGGSYLSITPGGDDKMMAANSYFENVQGAIDLMNMIGRAAGGDSMTNQAPKPAPKPVQSLPEGP
jgi:phospholipid/cholesterol/gamma-HCH transport system substrate-binding protein